MVSKPQYALLFAVLCFTASLFGQIATDETPFIEHEILVMLANDVQPDKVLTELAEDVDFQILSVPSPSTNIYLVHVDGPSWAEALGKFKSHRHVRAAQLNHLVSERETVPNDPNFGQQWHHVESGDHDIDSDLAWDVTTGGVAGNGARIVVAVLEGGGSNYSHTDLIDNHWTNPGEVPDNGIDDDNNGYVDDYNGWNVGSNNDNIAGGGHGTSVSGMIGATGNNGTGGAGV
ncbi:MAG: S8 family serine peptidase, partial [Flavobacteriales bacterium]